MLIVKICKLISLSMDLNLLLFVFSDFLIDIILCRFIEAKSSICQDDVKELIEFGLELFCSSQDMNAQVYINLLVLDGDFIPSASLCNMPLTSCWLLCRLGGLIFWTDFYWSIERSSRLLLIGGLSMTFYWVCTLRGWFLWYIALLWYIASLKWHSLIYCFVMIAVNRS